jgi:hypothetical protein
MQRALNQACGYLARIQCHDLMQTSHLARDIVRASFDDYHSVLLSYPVVWIIYQEMRASALKYITPYTSTNYDHATWEFERAIQYGDDVFLRELIKESPHYLNYRFTDAETTYIDEQAFYHFINLVLSSVCSLSAHRKERTIQEIETFLTEPSMFRDASERSRQSYLAGLITPSILNDLRYTELMFHFDLDALKMVRDYPPFRALRDKTRHVRYTRPVIASPAQIYDLASSVYEIPEQGDAAAVSRSRDRASWVRFVAEWYVGQPNWSPECLREIARVAATCNICPSVAVQPGRLSIKYAYFPSMAHVRAFAQYSDVLVVEVSESLVDFTLHENSPESLALFARIIGRHAPEGEYMSATCILRDIYRACYDDIDRTDICQAWREEVANIISRAPLESYKFAVGAALTIDDLSCMRLALNMPGVTVDDVQWCASLCFHAYDDHMRDLAVSTLIDKYGALPLFANGIRDRNVVWKCSESRTSTISLSDVLIIAQYHAGANWELPVRGRNIVLSKRETKTEALIREIARIHPENIDILSRILSDPSVVHDILGRELCAKCIKRVRRHMSATSEGSRDSASTS